MKQSEPQTTTSGQWPWLGAAALLLAAVASRLIGLSTLEPWYDEVGSFVGAVHSTWTELLQWHVQFNPEHSPLPFMEIRAAMWLLGESIFAIRLPAALYGVASVLLLYIGVGRIASWRLGFFAALLLLMHPCAVEWGREARMYSGWLFATIAIVMAAHTAVQRTTDRRRSAWAWWFGLGMLFMFAHAQAIHAVTTVGGTALAVTIIAAGRLRDRQYDMAARLVIGLFVAAAAYVCNWSWVGLLKLETVEGARETDYAVPLLPPLDHVTGLVSELAGYVPLAAAIALWVGALGGVVLLYRQGRRHLAIIVLLTCFASLGLYPPIVAKHFYSSRYLLVLLVPMCVGLGALAAWCWGQRAAGKIAVLIVIASLGLLWERSWWDIYTQPKYRIADAIAPVTEMGKPDEMVAVVPSSSAIFFRWYDRGEAQLVGYWWEGLVHDDGAVRGDRPPATWLIIQSPHQRRDIISLVLQAYGWDPDSFMDNLPRPIGYMSVRISDRSIGPVTPLPPGRAHAGRRYRLDD